MSRGYIAIVSALAFASVLTMLVLSASAHAFATRFNQIRHVDRAWSELTTYECIFTVLNDFAKNISYSTSTTPIILSPDETCIVEEFIVSTSSLSFISQGTYRNAQTRIRTTANIHADGTMEITNMWPATSTPP